MGTPLFSVMLVKPGTSTALNAVKKKQPPLPPMLMLAKENRSSHPLGEIALPIQFSTIENFCTEYVNFLVANFDTAYHAILGRLALAKFMAIPHYSYLVLKMPAPGGVLTLKVPVEELEIMTLVPPRAAIKAKETKEVDLNTSDKDKTTKIGANLDPK
ncbi:uncharacterized protein [Miscanthus floridulus]|uniref:uncharacterized protein n=1 Tax=Miscanthus floridulus TaxID=154761 RepID=UPI0034589577